MMFLDRSSRCAGLLDRGEIGDVSGGSSRCAGLLDRGEKDDVSGFWIGAPAAWGCSIEERKVMFLDRSSRCAGLLDRGEICDVSGGSSRCAELLGRGEKDDVSGQELPLRGAAR